MLCVCACVCVHVCVCVCVRVCVCDEGIQFMKNIGECEKEEFQDSN